MNKNIVMPEMGEGVIEGTVVRWLKQTGQTVQRNEPVLEIETDKVTVEVTAEIDGTLLAINVDEGQTVSVGTVLAIIGDANPAQIQSSTLTSAPGASPTANPVQTIISNGFSTNSEIAEKASSRLFDGIRVSPVVARMLQVHDINPSQLTGSGRAGRVTKQDVLNYLDRQENSPAAIIEKPAVPTVLAMESKPEIQPILMNAGDELLALTGMRRSIAEHMVRSKHTSPHATTVFEFDFSGVSKHRTANKETFERDGVKLTFMPYLALATVQALKSHPLANATWTDEGILQKRAIHLGIAVAIPTGLIVPVIKNADSLNLLGLARAINDVSERARTNQLKSDDIKNGTFTISNHGVSGSLIGTPIINQPQSGILGIGMIEKRVKVVDDAIAIRLCAYISFSFDHRILDGASADSFVSDIKHIIENFQ